MRTRTAVQEFLSSRKAMGLSPRTIRWYRGLLNPFSRINPQLPQDPGTIEGFLGALNGSDETRHGYFRALRAFYRWLSRRHALVNPMETIGPPRRRRKTPYSLTTTKLGWLLMVPLSSRDRALLTLLIDTGVRIGEALGLVRDDVFEETIIVSGKTGEREVPISPETKEHLILHVSTSFETFLRIQQSDELFSRMRLLDKTSRLPRVSNTELSQYC